MENQYIANIKTCYEFSKRAIRFVGPMNIIFLGVAGLMFYEVNYKKLYLSPRYSYTMPYLQSPRLTRNLYEKL